VVTLVGEPGKSLLCCVDLRSIVVVEGYRISKRDPSPVEQGWVVYCSGLGLAGNGCVYA